MRVGMCLPQRDIKPKLPREVHACDISSSVSLAYLSTMFSTVRVLTPVTKALLQQGIAKD